MTTALNDDSSCHHNIIETSPAHAIAFARDSINKNPAHQLRKFKTRYRELQDIVRTYGSEERNNMPAINWKEVKGFQQALRLGLLDISPPFSPDYIAPAPLSEISHDDVSRSWLNSGWQDGDLTDDRIRCEQVKIPASELIPVQSEIFFSKICENFHRYHFRSREIRHKTLIIGLNNEIIDGHHRWASCYLIGRRKKIHALRIHLNVRALLLAARLYGSFL